MPVTGIGAAADTDPVASLVSTLNSATTSLTAATASSLQKSSNLSDLSSASTSRTNLGLGSAATMTPASLAADSNFADSYGRIRSAIRGNRFAFLGDSIIIGQGNEVNAPSSWGLSFPSYATYLSKGKIVRVKNAGVSGNTAAQMLARFDTDITPYPPSAVVILAGTNDTNDSTATTLSSYSSTMTSLVLKCRKISAAPILCTLPPNIVSTARRGRVTLYNAWLRAYAATEGIPLIDFYNLLVDPSTGDYLAAYGSASNDKTHPTNAGYAAMGSFLYTSLSSVLPPVDQLLPMENSDPNNLITNGLNLTTTGSGTSLMPTSWSVQTSVHPSGVTGSLVTGDATIKGNWWQVVANGSASTTNNEFQTLSGITAGHVYAHVGRFKATGLRGADSGSGSQVLIGAAFNSTLLNNAYDFRAVSSVSYDVSEGTYYHEMTAPSDASTLLVRRQLLNTTAGAGTLQVAQVGVYDLTALGLTSFQA